MDICRMLENLGATIYSYTYRKMGLGTLNETIIFKHDGKKWRLEAVRETSGTTSFIVFDNSTDKQVAVVETINELIDLF